MFLVITSLVTLFLWMNLDHSRNRSYDSYRLRTWEARSVCTSCQCWQPMAIEKWKANCLAFTLKKNSTWRTDLDVIFLRKEFQLFHLVIKEKSWFTSKPFVNMTLNPRNHLIWTNFFLDILLLIECSKTA